MSKKNKAKSTGQSRGVRLKLRAAILYSPDKDGYYPHAIAQRLVAAGIAEVDTGK